MGYHEIIIKTNSYSLEEQIKKINELRKDSVVNMCIDPVEFIATAKKDIYSTSIKAGDEFIVLCGEGDYIESAATAISLPSEEYYSLENIVSGDYNSDFEDTTLDKRLHIIRQNRLADEMTLENTPKVKSKTNIKKEEYIRQKKEQINQVNEEIKEILANYRQNPEQLQQLLEFSALFYKYSVKNNMLIMKQNPGATFVQSFDKWKEAGYNVLKGQKAMKIFVPVNVTYIGLKNSNNEQMVKLSVASNKLKDMYYNHSPELTVMKQTHYQLGNVFDISQTDCPPEQYPDFYSMGYTDTQQDALINGIINYCENDLNISVIQEDLTSISLRGYYDAAANKIALSDKMNSSEKLSTLSHELGHAVMEHGGFDSLKDTHLKEFEADCFCIMMDKHLGIEVTDARQNHLTAAFKKLIEQNPTQDIQLDNIINTVFSKFRNTVESLDTFINHEIESEHESILDNKENILEDRISHMGYTYEKKVQMLHEYETPINETAINNRYDELLKEQKEINSYLKAKKAFMDVSSWAEATMSKQNSEWGAWVGHVANSQKPQDYIRIHITGYSTHHQVSYSVDVIRENKVIDNNYLLFDTDKDNLAESLKNINIKAYSEISDFLKESVKNLDIDVNADMIEYIPYAEKDIELHTKLLINKGYEEFPSYETYYNQKDELKQFETDSCMSKTSDVINIIGMSSDEKEGIVQGIENAIDNGYNLSDNDYKTYQAILQERSSLNALNAEMYSSGFEM